MPLEAPLASPARWMPLRYHAEQARLWQSAARFVYVVAGRRSGKSELAKRKLIRALSVPKPWPDPRYFYAAPTRQQAKDLAWEDLLALLPSGYVVNPERDISHSDLTIRTGFGSRLKVVGLDEPQRVEGLGYDGGVVDECSDVKPRALKTSLLPTLADRDGWLWQIGVPKRFGVGASRFREEWEKARAGQRPDSAAFWWPSADILTSDQLAFFRETMDAPDFEEQFNARWQSPTGRIFHAFARETNIRACSWRPDEPVIVGCDFNINPMAWVLGHVTESPAGRTMEWFDELWMRDCNTVKALDSLWARYGQSSRAPFLFFGDASGRGRHTSASTSDYQHIALDARFKSLGSTISFPDANPPIADRFAACNAMFCNAAGHHAMFVDDRCEHLIADLEFRSYKPGGREPDDSDKDISHSSDALGYSVFSLFPVGHDRQKGSVGVYVSRRK